jgi:hypothetical protein
VAFFLLQPLLLALERRLRIRHWPVAARRVWTAAALAIGAPLFGEPFIRLFV